MSQEIQKSVDEVAESIRRLNAAFEDHVKILQQESEQDHLERWVKATQAMQDSGQIYLTWAKHYAGIAEPGQDEENPILDEGAPITN